MTITGMSLSELEDYGRITEILSRVRKIEKKLDQIERRLEMLLKNQPEEKQDEANSTTFI